MQTPLEFYLNHFKITPQQIERPVNSHSSQVYLLELPHEKLVLKIPFNPIKWEREYRPLNLLTPHLPVPKVLDAYPGKEAPGALLLSFLPGKHALEKRSSHQAYQMGELLAKIHRTHMPEFNDNHQGWWANTALIFKDWLSLLAPHISKKNQHKYQHYFDILYPHLPPADGPCLVHFDYQPINLLFQGDQISGILDFESSRGGSADMDFTKIANKVWCQSKQLKSSFLEGYQTIRAIPPYEETLPFYHFWHAVGGLARCVKRQCIGNDFWSLNARQLEAIFR